jgi:hypothetical protein
LKQILGEVPRGRVGLVLLVVAVNVGVATCRRAEDIAWNREAIGGVGSWHGGDSPVPVPPWEWTASEWRESCPWMR